MPEDPAPACNAGASDDTEVAGLAGERTDMAWSRSGLAVLSCLAAIAKRALGNLNEVSGRAVILAALLVGIVGWAIGLAWARLVARGTMEGRTVANPRTLAMTAYGTAALGAAALALAVIP